MMGTKDKAQRRDYVAIIEAETKKTEAYIESYSKTNLTKEEQETLPKFRTAFEQYKKLRARIIELSLGGKGRRGAGSGGWRSPPGADRGPHKAPRA